MAFFIQLNLINFKYYKNFSIIKNNNYNILYKYLLIYKFLTQIFC